MTHATKHLYFAVFILTQIEINLPSLEWGVDLLLRNIIGEDAWELLINGENITVGSEFAYMVNNNLIPFTRVGKNSTNWALYRRV